MSERQGELEMWRTFSIREFYLGGRDYYEVRCTPTVVCCTIELLIHPIFT
jgi:hypothetical protein